MTTFQPSISLSMSKFVYINVFYSTSLCNDILKLSVDSIYPPWLIFILNKKQPSQSSVYKLLEAKISEFFFIDLKLSEHD